MSRQELADLVNARLYGAGDRLLPGGIDAKYIGKLERGVYRWPNELYRKAFRQVLKIATDVELGFFVVRQPRQQLVLLTSDRPQLPAAPLAWGTPSGSDVLPGNASEATEWPVWFGMRLAHAVSIVHNWTGEHFDVLQTLLHQEILMFDASAPQAGQAIFETSRRQALVTLATLPLAFGSPRHLSESNAATEFFLSHCGASLTACWHLLKGSDLDTVDRLLNGYLMQLEVVARRPSKYGSPGICVGGVGDS